MNFKVLAINKDGNEIQRVFDSKEEAEKYAKICEEKGCFCIHVAEGNFRK